MSTINSTSNNYTATFLDGKITYWFKPVFIPNDSKRQRFLDISRKHFDKNIETLSTFPEKLEFDFMFSIQSFEKIEKPEKSTLSSEHLQKLQEVWNGIMNEYNNMQ